MRLCNKNNYFIVGRGSTGIYLVLKSHFNKKKVLLPANICYAAVFAVIYSGNYPVFCDVDSKSGNVNLNDIISCPDDISAMIIPHMYGNPVKEIERVSSYCKKRGILLIEDCASAMGAKASGMLVGSFGDYTIYSTGYSKTVDVGNGGIIATDFSLKHEIKLYNELPLFSDSVYERNNQFSRLYRQFRNSGINYEDSDFSRLINSDLSSNYLYRLPVSFEKKIWESIDSLDKIIAERRYKINIYSDSIRFNIESINDYSFSRHSVPWRMNVFVDKSIRSECIRQLLARQIPVSDWYPVVAILFGDSNNYPNANVIEKTILNFPLLIPDEQIRYISNELNQIIEVVTEEK